MDQIFEPGYLVESAPSAGASTDAMKSSSTQTPKRSRRLLKKRVILTPIKDSEGSRLKGEGTPPTDSWAWRKYGQKPIKGSPYPRGYYRCSSSKGCPARKQVERSRDDPTMLIITYSCEHNHPWPMPRNNHHHHQQKASAAASTTDDAPSKSETSDISTLNREAEQEQELEPKTEPEPGEKFAHIKDELPLMPVEDEFGWFADLEMTNSSLMMSPFLYRKTFWDDRDLALLRPTREEDESLFADLGELPECSVVFRHLDLGTQVQIC